MTLEVSVNGADDLDTYAQRMMAAYQIPGLALAAVRDGRVRALRGYGAASLEFSLPADTASVFPLYSVSKVFAGIAAMQLVQAGLLELDRPIPKLLGADLPHWRALTLRHMLSHTSGLAGWPEGLATERPADGAGARAMIGSVAEQPLTREPGYAFAYHQTGYGVFGLLLQALTGQPYAAWLAERVFAPLGMQATSFGDSYTVVPQRSPAAYIREGGVLKHTVYRFSETHYSAAGLNSSIADLAALLVALDQGRLLPPDALEQLWPPTRLADGTLAPYGLGWTVDTYRGMRVVGHEGGGAAWIAHLPESRLSVAVLCNLNGARADEIQYGIIDRML
jgi:CubicO group peptidase (beta-lactamase class C family)